MYGPSRYYTSVRIYIYIHTSCRGVCLPIFLEGAPGEEGFPGLVEGTGSSTREPCNLRERLGKAP